MSLMCIKSIGSPATLSADESYAVGSLSALPSTLPTLTKNCFVFVFLFFLLSHFSG